MSSFRKRVAPDFSKNVLEQYSDLEEDEDDLEPQIEEEVEAVTAPEGADAVADDDDGVKGVSRKRPKMTPDLVASKLDTFLGPKFRALSEVKSSELWVSKLLRLYEEWADSVFPSVGLEQFLKRLEKMSSSVVIKDGLFNLARKRARMDDIEAEDAENAAAAAAAAVLPAADAAFPELEDSVVQQAQPAVPADEEEDDLVLIYDE